MGGHDSAENGTDGMKTETESDRDRLLKEIDNNQLSKQTNNNENSCTETHIRTSSSST